MSAAPMNTHVPVMLDEVMASLAPRDGGRYLDGTFGGGGYAQAILERAQCTLWAIDRDPEAIERGASLLARFPGRLHLLHGQFGDMVTLLDQAGVSALDGIVLDLGVSSFQIDDPQRGFSFRHDGPLDMRMGKHGTSAADLVNTLPERSLSDLLYELGKSGRPAASPMPLSLPVSRHQSKPPAASRKSSVRCCRRIVRATTPRPGASRRFASRSTTNWGRSRPHWSRRLRCSPRKAGLSSLRSIVWKTAS